MSTSRCLCVALTVVSSLLLLPILEEQAFADDQAYGPFVRSKRLYLPNRAASLTYRLTHRPRSMRQVADRHGPIFAGLTQLRFHEYSVSAVRGLTAERLQAVHQGDVGWLLTLISREGTLSHRVIHRMFEMVTRDTGHSLAIVGGFRVKGRVLHDSTSYAGETYQNRALLEPLFTTRLDAVEGS